MKTLLKVLAGLFLVLLLVFFAGGSMLGGEVRVERSGVVPAPPFMVQATLEDLSTWPEWSAWNKEVDPQAEWSFEGEPGPGMRWSWTSEGPLGTGNLLVIESSEDRVVYEVSFDAGEEMMVIRDEILLAPTPEGTEVRWIMDTSFDDTMFKWLVALGLFEEMLGSNYETGIAGLQARLAATEE